MDNDVLGIRSSDHPFKETAELAYSELHSSSTPALRGMRQTGVRLFVCLFVCLFTGLFVCLFVRLFIHSLVLLFIHTVIFPPVL